MFALKQMLSVILMPTGIQCGEVKVSYKAQCCQKDASHDFNKKI